MSEDINKDIDSMSDAELATALKSEVDALDGKVAPEPAPEAETESEPVQEEAQKAESEQGVEDEVDTKEDGNPYRKRIDRLLRKRDALQETLAEKEARIAELEALQSQQQSLLDPQESYQEEDYGITSAINKVLDEREKKSKTQVEKLKAVEDEFSKLVSKVPDASKRKSEILELAEKHPTLTFEAIDRIIAPEDHIDPIDKNRKNARRMDVGSRSRADLESEKDVTKASTADQEKYLKEMERSGKLVI